MAEHKPVGLFLISAYQQGRLDEPIPERLSLISAYGQERMAEPKPV